MKKLVYVIVSLTIVGISGCDILLGPNAPLGKGTLSIGFGDNGGGRSARSLDEGTLAELRYELVLSGPDNQRINVSLAAGKTYKEQVSLGEWRIEAEAYLDKDAISVLFGKGMTTVRVRAGTNEAEVPMTVVDTLVSDLDLTELVNVPVKDGEPDTRPINREEYTGSIAWEEEDGTPFSGTFAEATVYHAVVRLTAATGYTFDGVEENSFIHSAPDVTVTNEAGSGDTIEVRIVFRETEAATPTQYTVTFKLNDGTNENLVTKTVSSGASIGSVDFPTNPSRMDYIFGGWNTQDDGGGSEFSSASTVSDNMTVYAQWTDNSSPPQYTIMFDSHDGSSVASITENTGTEVTKPVDPTRTGYTFEGWFSMETGGVKYTWPHPLTTDVTMHAQWTGNTYTVLFKSNYDSNDTLDTKTVTVPATKIDATDFPLDPWRNNYIFDGWNIQNDGLGAPFTPATTVNDDITVYAQWTAVVSEFDLTGLVTAPVKGAAPVTTAINTGQYTGDISWQEEGGSSVSGNFAVATVYQAVLNLTAATGYTFTGVNADSFTYTDATVTNPVGNGTNIMVTITFPPTVEVFGNGTITLSFNDAGSGAFDKTDFTVKQGDVTQNTQSINLASPSAWVSREWRVDGVLKSSDPTFTVDAADYTGGGHILQVTVKDSDNKFWSKTLPFTVTSVVTGVSLNKSTMDLLKDETRTLTATVSPLHAADKAVTWTSSVPTVATVNGGMVTAVGAGTTVITVTSVDDPLQIASCTINVTDSGSGGITLSFNDDGVGAFNKGPFTVKQSESETETITLVGSWTSQDWRVDGVLKSNDPTFTVNAVDYTVGGHILQVTVEDTSGKFWSKTLPFTVED